MNSSKISLSFLFVFFLLNISLNITAQSRELIKWKDFSDSTFVFEISNKEAEKFLKEGKNEELMKSMLHTHVATFVNRWDHAPEQGHFIYANIHQNRINLRYAPEMPFQVFLFREYGVLTLQIIDNKGEVRKDAKIKIQGAWRLFDSRINFDENTNTYRIDDWSENTNRILTIELDKFKAFFDLEKHLVHPWYDNNYGGGGSSGPSFYSYMITDKNKYKPKEKVRFKSYALKGNKKPIKEDLEVWMNTENYTYKKITEISPYNPGGFAGEINLDDSLKLRLDRHYQLQLRDRKGKIVAATEFRYEDYELYDNKMEVKVKGVHYYPNTHPVEIKVTDANGLIMPGMKATITISRGNVHKSYVDLLVLPNTIHQEVIKMEDASPTIYNIPSTYFDRTDCDYIINVEVLTNDGQLLKSNHYVRFYKSNYSITSTTKSDSIYFNFFDLGKEKEVEAYLSIDGEENSKKIQLPYAEKFG